MASFERFDIAEAHCVLEWDYNLGGWLRERPANRRRMEATGVQLHRMGFRAHRDLSYDKLSANAREIYLQRVLDWRLPRDEEQNARIRSCFDKEWLLQQYPSVYADIFRPTLH